MMASNKPIYKYQGAGNDFVLIETSSSKTLSEDLVRHLCDRHHCLGADGVLQVHELSNKPSLWRMRIYNADGTLAKMCGNGLRCVAAHVWKKTGSTFAFTIQSDVDLHQIEPETAPSTYQNQPELYYAKTCFGKITAPFGHYRLSDLDLTQSQQWLAPDQIQACYFLNSGVPHLFFLTHKTVSDLKSLGHFWRYHERFSPLGTNVSIGYLEDEILHLQTYERGVEDVTLACGTGAVAAAFACMDFQSRNHSEQKMTIQFPGEPVMTVSCDANKHFWLCGPAAFVFEAKLANDSRLVELA